MTYESIPLETLRRRLPPVWPDDLRASNRRMIEAAKRKLIVLDDDPTGTQTMHGVPVVTSWSVDLLAAELRDPGPTAYILTNARSVDEATAVSMNREIAANLIAASKKAGRDFTIVSRSDSTLRGHFPAEMVALRESLGRSFDAWVLCPFFLEGGRITADDVHYVIEGPLCVPAAETPFARDKAFGYESSNLRDWIVEKSGGAIQRDRIASLTLDDLRRGGPDIAREKIARLPRGSILIVNAAAYRDLEVAASALLSCEARGAHFLYRTAASIVPVRSGIDRRDILAADEMADGQGSGLLVVVGSHVPKTTSQLEHLARNGDASLFELQVTELLDKAKSEAIVTEATRRVDALLAAGRTAVVHTSRRPVQDDGSNGLAIGRTVSDALVAVVRGLTVRPRVIIAKGGITSSDIATAACGIRRAMVLGQIAPGVPVWRCGSESRFAGMPLVVFPGNVGGDDALTAAVQRLS